VQKVSNLILNMNIAVRDAGRVLAGVRADARGNTQESRPRALDYLAANRFGPGAL
jgi:hypothetical protein